MWSQATVTLLLASSLGAAVVTASPLSYPLFKQCDSRWGGNEMGVNGPGERSTICGEGCAMSCVSMVLNGTGTMVPNAAGEPVSTDPATLNAWLMANDGYTCIAGDCNNLVLDAPDKVPGSRLKLRGENPKPPADQMTKEVLAGTAAYVAHVHDNGHFVLITGVVQADGRVSRSPLFSNLRGRSDRSQQVMGGSETMFEVNDPFYSSTAYPYANITDCIVYDIEQTL